VRASPSLGELLLQLAREVPIKRFGYLFRCLALHRRSQAAARSTGRRGIGFPPGGFRGPSSNAQSASRISSMVIGALPP